MWSPAVVTLCMETARDGHRHFSHCLDARLFKEARRSWIIFALDGIGFCQTQSAPASKNCVPISLPEHPMMTEFILIRRIANTTSVPTITPPASSMY
mmetsp:Transcript_40537/g.62366  ORF Transcript_40537/g.62366 Transcript_40537/m.62366 type:complete len:97 (+) Transcript_40537:586-876(+)